MTTYNLQSSNHDDRVFLSVHFDDGSVGEVIVSGADNELSVSINTAEGLRTVVDVDESPVFEKDGDEDGEDDPGWNQDEYDADRDESRAARHVASSQIDDSVGKTFLYVPPLGSSPGAPHFGDRVRHLVRVSGLANPSTYDREEVGTMYVGVFEDGTEVTMFRDELR